MFSKTILIAASFALLAAATPVPDNTNSCNTGKMQCCNQVYSSDHSAAKSVAALNNIDLSGVTGNVGLTCSPITAVGVGGGGKCSSNPVCCSGNNFNGLIVIGCSPINVNL